MNLRQKTLQGSAFLVGRQVGGIVLSLIGVLVVTRIIGPHSYGLFATVSGIVTFLFTFGTWGLDVYLLRISHDPTAKEFDQVFTLLLYISGAFTCVLVIFRNMLGNFLHMPESGNLTAVLAFAIPLNLLALPAIVKLDRALDFRRVAFNELVSQMAYYLVAIPLAAKGAGAWAPAVGFLTQQGSLLVLSYAAARLKLRLYWEYPLIRRMLNYGLGYSSSIWIWQLRNLVNPLIVGRFGGAEAVAYVAVSIRFTTLLSFAKSVTWRVAMAALAKLEGDVRRLRNSITEGMRLQGIAVGIPLAAFAVLAPFVLPLVFGPKWSPALGVFPFIALGCLANSMFTLHSSVLYLLQKNWEVTWFHCVHILLFAGSAAILVANYGFIGYGWAEVAGLASYWIIHLFVAREVGSPSYAIALVWFTIALCVLVLCAFGAPFSYYASLILLIPLFIPKERASLMGYAQLLLSRSSI